MATMTLQEFKHLISQILKTEDMDAFRNVYDVYQLLLNIRDQYNFEDNPDALAFCMKISKYVHEMSIYQANRMRSADFLELYWRAMLFEAPWHFESYLYYMERRRPLEKQFYAPRHKTLGVVVDALQDLEDRKYKFLGVSEPPRTGKAVAYDTPVLTNHGWKRHGELTILDKVIGLDGKFKNIYAIHNPCIMEYEVEFADGEIIQCHGNHEWRVFDRLKAKPFVDIETRAMYETYSIYDGKERNRYFALSKNPIVGEEKTLLVDPYTLGVWLGDGRNQSPDICGAESDYPVVQKVLDNGYELAWDTKHKTTGVRYYGFRELRKQLQQYGMCHSRTRTEKHIPDEYFTASIEQRLALLAGLLDTDGSLRRSEHRYNFTTNEPRLRDDFVSLVNTFGWRTCVSRYESGMSPSGIYANKPYWAISFNPTMYIPCQLERKQLREFSKPRRTAIKSIRKIADHEVYGNCITVEDGVYCVGRTLKPTHNSSLCIFFLTWIMGKRPNSHNAMSGHSGILADGFYSEVLNLIGTDEYTFSEIFPGVALQKKSAEKKEINLDRPDRFPTLTCRGIDGTWTGAVDISSDGYLYVDDLVRDRMESLSPTRLEGRYQDYLNVLVDRKNDGSRELMVGTRWNVLDPLGRIEADKKNDPQYKFVKIPALNENDESNFDYAYGVGFSTEYFRDIRSRLDRNEWEAKYQQKPFIREGLLFPEDELSFYNGVLPEGDSRVVAAVDVAWGGGDSLSMPIGREYENGEVYIFDWVFSKGKKEETLPLVAGKIMENEIRQICFESDQGGLLYAQYIDERLKEHNYKCSCTSKRAPNRVSKMEKIIAYSGDIKRKYHFLDEEHRSVEYKAAMEEMCMFVTIGKNDHDDAPDSLTQLEMFIETKERKSTVIMPSLF